MGSMQVGVRQNGNQRAMAWSEGHTCMSKWREYLHVEVLQILSGVVVDFTKVKHVFWLLLRSLTTNSLDIRLFEVCRWRLCPQKLHTFSQSGHLSHIMHTRMQILAVCSKQRAPHMIIYIHAQMMSLSIHK